MPFFASVWLHDHSFCIRIEYTASFTQKKHSLDWTLTDMSLKNNMTHNDYNDCLKWFHCNPMLKNTQSIWTFIKRQTPIGSHLPFPLGWPLNKGLTVITKLKKNTTNTNNTYWCRSQQSEHHGPRRKDHKTSSMGEQHLPCKTTMSHVQHRSAKNISIKK